MTDNIAYLEAMLRSTQHGLEQIPAQLYSVAASLMRQAFALAEEAYSLANSAHDSIVYISVDDDDDMYSLDCKCCELADLYEHISAFAAKELRDGLIADDLIGGRHD